MASHHAYANKTAASSVVAPQDDWKFFTQIRAVTDIDKKGNVTEEAWCGGSYIGNGYVLTAAHCVDTASTLDLSVRIGAHTENGSDGVIARVSKIYIHPFYEILGDEKSVNDIALLQLETIPKGVEAVKLATKPLNNYVYTDDILETVGFSDREESKRNQPNELRSVQIPYISKAQCDAEYHDIGKGEFCAGYNSPEKAKCLFDNGGPVVVRQNGEVTQLGVINWGGGCNGKQKYGVYADVSALSTFIDAITNLKKP